jgi:hypothetical protein
MLTDKDRAWIEEWPGPYIAERSEAAEEWHLEWEEERGRDG